jgi:hypothetical protein
MASRCASTSARSAASCCRACPHRTTAGMACARWWARVCRPRSGSASCSASVPWRDLRRLGCHRANTNTINVDNRVGSCGRVPFWEKTNLRLVRYDVESDSHPRDANGFLMACQAGEVGEAIGMIHNYPDIVAGRFEGYTSPRPTERKILRNVFREGDAYWSRATCCAATTTATAGSSTASATPSAGRAKTSRPWKWPMRFRPARARVNYGLRRAGARTPKAAPAWQRW